MAVSAAWQLAARNLVIQKYEHEQSYTIEHDKSYTGFPRK